MANHTDEVTSNKSNVKGLFYRTRKQGRTKRWVSLHTLVGTTLIEEIYVPQLGNRNAIRIMDEIISLSTSSLDISWDMPAEEILASNKHVAVLRHASRYVEEKQNQKYKEQYEYQRKNAEGKPRKH